MLTLLSNKVSSLYSRRSIAQSKEMNIPEQHPSPPLLTREEILLRNNGSMTLDKAAATFNVDLKTFKAILLDENIFVWNDVDNTKFRIHGRGDYIITMYVSVPDDVHRVCEVRGWYPFESVISIIEEQHNLTHGFYKLSYKHYDPSVGDVLIQTNRDWHEAVKFSKSFNYLMQLDLKKIPVDDANVSPSASRTLPM